MGPEWAGFTRVRDETSNIIVETLCHGYSHGYQKQFEERNHAILAQHKIRLEIRHSSALVGPSRNMSDASFQLGSLPDGDSPAIYSNDLNMLLVRALAEHWHIWDLLFRLLNQNILQSSCVLFAHCMECPLQKILIVYCHQSFGNGAVR
ncbi:hypothetical protein QAD02_001054 [Eretmocerus hayati]|uniref:Uncharacterized protein n=1 Tax=Eretmocerus hayati TaxID=131215 RepID=A0ACC2NJR7_9HYME|nr:hypothetical protein QAD02_001054 [Eretmocerus hayati]